MVMEILRNKKASCVWEHFYHLSKIPRPSKNESLARDYIANLAQKYGHQYQVDQAGNILVFVKSSAGYEKYAPLLIQGHLDMVTDAIPGKKIDFNKDPIELVIDGKWLKANGTTLGADNGIGCAAALSYMTDQSLQHPSLELLFTVDEETGLGGALGLQAQNIKAKYMLNLDTEEWGSVYIGCAGGVDFDISKKLNFIQSNTSFVPVVLNLKNFAGGHSGVDIHLQRANANKMMLEFLNSLELDFQLSSWKSGRAHNIIPRDAEVLIYIEESKIKDLEKHKEAEINRWNTFLSKEDKNYSFKIEKTTGSNLVLDDLQKKEVLMYLTLFPHGPASYLLSHGPSSIEDAMVSISDNMAIVIIAEQELYLKCSLRFFNRKEAISLERKINMLSRYFGFQVRKHSEYPSWQPNFDQKLLKDFCSFFAKQNGKEVKIKAIHAGLECGIISDKLPEIEAISFGPTIMGAHSPDERVDIETVDLFWLSLKNYISQFKMES